MDGYGWEIAFAQQSVQFGCSTDTLDKDDDLVEFQCVEQVVEFTVLLSFVETDKVLLQSMKSQLGLVVDINLKGLQRQCQLQFTDGNIGRCYILHEFLANGTDLLRQCGREHHDLFMMWGSTEHILDIPSHIYTKHVLVSAKGNPNPLGGGGGKGRGVMPTASNILSHSSKTKFLTLLTRRYLSLTSPFNRPGVATTIWGQVSLFLINSTSF